MKDISVFSNIFFGNYSAELAFAIKDINTDDKADTTQRCNTSKTVLASSSCKQNIKRTYLKQQILTHTIFNSQKLTDCLICSIFLGGSLPNSSAFLIDFT